MENNELKVVPLVAYESMLAREDKQQRRMVIVIILLIVLLAVSNTIWVLAWNSYDYVDDYSIELDGGDGGNANYIGEDGDIYNGKSESKP